MNNSSTVHQVAWSLYRHSFPIYSWAYFWGDNTQEYIFKYPPRNIFKFLTTLTSWRVKIRYRALQWKVWVFDILVDRYLLKAPKTEIVEIIFYPMLPDSRKSIVFFCKIPRHRPFVLVITMRMWKWVQSTGRMTVTEERRRKSCPSATLPTTKWQRDKFTLVHKFSVCASERSQSASFSKMIW
jgi:hypothetical protein